MIIKEFKGSKGWKIYPYRFGFMVMSDKRVIAMSHGKNEEQNANIDLMVEAEIIRSQIHCDLKELLTFVKEVNSAMAVAELTRPLTITESGLKATTDKILKGK